MGRVGGLTALLAACLSACADGGRGGAAEAPADAPGPCPLPDFSREAPYTRVDRIVFDEEDGAELDAVLMIPEGEGPFPALVLLHSGAWFFGDWRLFEGAARRYAAAGFVVMNVDYRIAPEATLPEMVRDSACALRWLQARAADYGVAPGCIGILGDSAGGQLADMIALVGDEPRYLERCEGAPEEVPEPLFVASYYGVHDMAAQAAHLPPVWREQLPQLVAEGDDFLLYSPILYADRRPEIPFFLAHGTFDTLVPYRESIDFDAALRAGGHASELHVVEGAPHGFISWLFWFLPYRDEIQPFADAFMIDNLAKGPRR